MPMLLTSGRTPITESGPVGTRNVHIHWAQEMFDQAGMLREMVKWDYEMRRGDQIPDGGGPRHGNGDCLAGRAGLSQPAARGAGRSPRRRSARRHHGRRIDRRCRRRPTSSMLAEWIAAARNAGDHYRHARPRSAGSDRAGASWRSDTRCQWCRTTRGISRSRANIRCSMGSQPGPLLTEADLVIVWESDVPWYPSQHAPPADARIVQIGEDPLYARYPMRSFPSDLTIRAARCPCWRRWPTRWRNASRHVAARRARIGEAVGSAARGLARRKPKRRGTGDNRARWPG